MQHLREIPISTSWEPAKFEYTKSSYGEMFQVLQSLRQHEVFCDIKLETDDDTIIFGHKVVLSSASPYFHAMFTHFAEKNKDLVVIRQVDSTTLQLLVDFIYSGKIIVTETNAQDLLAAANLLQLNEVNEICCEFLRKQLCPTNCLGIKALADLHSCTTLLKSSELYIQQNFSEVVEAGEFLSLSSEQVIKLISSDELKVASEEKVFECVIRWVKHEFDSRKCSLSLLMEHVRLPLTSENYIFQKVLKEPILNNCHKCKYECINEALHYHSLKSNQSNLDITIPECIRYKPRLGDKVILVIGGYRNIVSGSSEWYDSKINQWKFGPEMITNRRTCGVAVLKDNFVFAVGGHNIISNSRSVEVLDLSSETPCWKSSLDMLVKRRVLGVGVINNELYAVGGHDGSNSLNSAEVFDGSTKEWHMVSSMSTRRSCLGVGVLNNLLYAVGGYSLGESLNSVECYHPSLDTWKPVAEMCERRCGPGVGVLDGVLYAVGGDDGSQTLKSVEAYRPCIGIWTTVADMHLPREFPGVVALEGLLYAVGGRTRGVSPLDSVEFYNPITNTWTMLGTSMNVARIYPGVVAIARHLIFKTSPKSGTGAVNPNLPPLRFHNVHGENVRLYKDGFVARRVDSFCKGVAFSSRPVAINEKVYIKFLEISDNWSGVLRFGFTSEDPSNVKKVPKYACTDLTSKSGFWAKALSKRHAVHDGLLFFYVDAGGDVHYGLNGESKGVFMQGIDTRSPLWVLLDIYGNSTIIEFLDCRPQLNNNRISRSDELEVSSQMSTVTLSSSTVPSLMMQIPSGGGECSICFERAVDCALYTCGHLCMCYECAKKQWVRLGRCPICRAVIKDVIKIYK